MQLSPIDAAEAYSRRIFTVDETRIEAVREQMGLNRPIVVQYCSALRYAPGYHLYGSDIYADDGNVYGGIRHSGKHFFSARIGVSDCKQPDKS